MIGASIVAIFLMALLAVDPKKIEFKVNGFRLDYEERNDGIFKGVIYLGFVSIWIKV